MGTPACRLQERVSKLQKGGAGTLETYRSLSRVTGCGCDSSAGSPCARGECVCVWSPFAWMLTLMKASKLTGFKRLRPAGNTAVARHGSRKSSDRCAGHARQHSVL